jgi:hypothetical protein
MAETGYKTENGGRNKKEAKIRETIQLIVTSEGGSISTPFKRCDQPHSTRYYLKLNECG